MQMSLPQRLFFAFIAGFAAVPAFHQLALAILHATGATQAMPFGGSPTWPWGVPAIWSASFWGGIWGLVYVVAERWFARGAGYYLSALIFGALGPSLVAWLVVFPLKGYPVAGGWHIHGLLLGLAVNGAWGLGVSLLLRPPVAKA